MCDFNGVWQMIRSQIRVFSRAPRLFLLACAAMLLSACAPGSMANSKSNAVDPSNVVAGHGEKTFAEKYHLAITLPMSEADFLAVLGRLKLHYDGCGERGTPRGLPPARHLSKVDLSEAQKCYEIAGERSPAVDEWYRAFVNKDHQVIYIENAFAYSGP